MASYHCVPLMGMDRSVTADVVMEIAEPTNASQTLQAARVLSGYSSTGLQPSR